jgi:ABC-type phosphate transport system auxiliary subunit
VPITVKLSERFYQKFGHEVVDEMVNWFNEVDATYRGDLRELNELNFARFDAKLEQRVTQLDAKLEQRVAQLDARLEQRLAEVKAELRQEIAQVRVELGALGGTLVKWMFAFWIGQAGLTIGLVLLVIGKR